MGRRPYAGGTVWTGRHDARARLASIRSVGGQRRRRLLGGAAGVERLMADGIRAVQWRHVVDGRRPGGSEFHFKGFACGSWLLDPTLQDFLPKTSNIVRFQSLFNLYPSPDGNDWQTRERVFGDPDLPLDKVPLKTSLQRIVHDQILNGHRFRSGNMFLPR